MTPKIRLTRRSHSVIFFLIALMLAFAVLVILWFTSLLTVDDNDGASRPVAPTTIERTP